MAQVAPTITAENPHVYREQIERVEIFASRIHVDLMDGVFTPNKSLAPDQLWFPENIQSDVHVMYSRPKDILSALVNKQPNLIILAAEMEDDFIECLQFITNAGIKCGIALLPDTGVESLKDILLKVDHVMIFSGNLGYQGGSVANLGMIEKIAKAKAINPGLEIGWDGGINESNVRALAAAGTDVLNVGGYIHHSHKPEDAYKLLKNLV